MLPTVKFHHNSNNIDNNDNNNNNINGKLLILNNSLFFFKITTKHLILNFYKSALLIRMYKCIKVREIESALCCLPSVPGQCNELASINKGDLKKLRWFPALETTKKRKQKKKKKKEKQRPAVSSYNLSDNQVQRKIRSCFSHRKQG